MRDIRDANPHTDGFELPPGSPFFGISPDDEPYGEYDDELDRWGDDETPHLPLALDLPQRRSLARAVEAGLADGGCDTTLRRAEAWARQEEVPWASLRRALEERGGFCDCEVLMNVLEPPTDGVGRIVVIDGRRPGTLTILRNRKFERSGNRGGSGSV